MFIATLDVTVNRAILSMKKLKNSVRLKPKTIWFFCLGIAAFFFLVRTYAAKNYVAPDSPRFSGNFALELPEPANDNEIVVVSYNIRYSQNIEQAIKELREIDALKSVDVILLQEMDEGGSKQIAEAIGANFVYFPAAIEPRYHKNIGNAILSKWPITESEKLILPHKSLSSRMNRIATKATITINNVSILVYSIHAETIFTLPVYRQDQFTAILDDIGTTADFVIVGGDFNTVTESNVAQLEAIFNSGGLTRTSAESGFTLVKYGIEAEADHIFSKGFLVQSADKVDRATASDHLPIWITLTLP